jgi:hypothetical protein
MVWDIVAGIVTDYRMDGVGMYSQWSEIYCIHPDWAWCLPRLLHSGYRVIPVKWLRHGVNHPLACSAEVKERPELYFSSPSVCSWHVLG